MHALEVILPTRTPSPTSTPTASCRQNQKKVQPLYFCSRRVSGVLLQPVVPLNWKHVTCRLIGGQPPHPHRLPLTKPKKDATAVLLQSSVELADSTKVIGAIKSETCYTPRRSASRPPPPPADRNKKRHNTCIAEVVELTGPYGRQRYR